MTIKSAVLVPMIRLNTYRAEIWTGTEDIKFLVTGDNAFSVLDQAMIELDEKYGLTVLSGSVRDLEDDEWPADAWTPKDISVTVSI